MAYKYRCLVLTCKTPWKSLRQLDEVFYNYCLQSASHQLSFLKSFRILGAIAVCVSFVYSIFIQNQNWKLMSIFFICKSAKSKILVPFDRQLKNNLYFYFNPVNNKEKKMKLSGNVAFPTILQSVAWLSNSVFGRSLKIENWKLQLIFNFCFSAKLFQIIDRTTQEGGGGGPCVICPFNFHLKSKIENWCQFFIFIIKNTKVPNWKFFTFFLLIEYWNITYIFPLILSTRKRKMKLSCNFAFPTMLQSVARLSFTVFGRSVKIENWKLQSIFNFCFSAKTLKIVDRTTQEGGGGVHSHSNFYSQHPLPIARSASLFNLRGLGRKWEFNCLFVVFHDVLERLKQK